MKTLLAMLTLGMFKHLCTTLAETRCNGFDAVYTSQVHKDIYTVLILDLYEVQQIRPGFKCRKSAKNKHEHELLHMCSCVLAIGVN